VRLYGHVKAHLKANVRSQRRETLWNMQMKRQGFVRCFVCNGLVKKEHATLEHIVPRAKGGTDEMSNLAISHASCNHSRGSNA
jgi:5-methylcytosine-specific restriction endonuclease McrA